MLFSEKGRDDTHGLNQRRGGDAFSTQNVMLMFKRKREEKRQGRVPPGKEGVSWALFLVYFSFLKSLVSFPLVLLTSGYATVETRIKFKLNEVAAKNIVSVSDPETAKT